MPNGVIWPYLHRDNPDGCDSCPFCLVLPCLVKLQQVIDFLIVPSDILLVRCSKTLELLKETDPLQGPTVAFPDSRFTYDMNIQIGLG